MRRGLAAAVTAALLPLAACSSGPEPDPVAKAFLAAWARGDDAGAGRLTDAPAAATTALTETRKALGVSRGELRLRTVTGKDNAATAPYVASWTLRTLGTWRYDGSLALAKASGKWRVHWTPADLHPRLTAGQRLGRIRALLERAPILDGSGAPMVRPTDVVTVSILPSALVDRRGTVALLGRTLGIDARRLTAALKTAKPAQLLPVITLRRSDYGRVRAKIHDVPGLRFPASTALLPPTPTFARAVLGRVGPATVEALKAAGPSYSAGDQLGLGGVQAAFQRQLAGTPAGSVVVLDAKGSTVSTLQAFPGVAGTPVRTTLDRRMQAAAEVTLATLRKPAALVAVRPSDGAILAAANAPADSAFDRALAGRYPPGSTFKVVTTAALLGRGLRIGDSVPCPPTRTVEGKTFSNFEGEAAGAVPFRRDFAISCNTAFVGLAARLAGSLLPDAARRLGVGAGWTLPLPSYAGSVPTPASAVERAADVIGQGRVTVSPLSMALVAAAVQNGTWRPPVLVTSPAPTAGPPVVALPEAPALRTLMRDVVTRGTAVAAFRSYAGPAVSGKTGTAEYGAGPAPPTHAWFIGFRGDLAFAVVVEGGGVGGAVAAPLAARFLSKAGA